MIFPLPYLNLGGDDMRETITGVNMVLSFYMSIAWCLFPFILYPPDLCGLFVITPLKVKFKGR
jgi:hypothetical protein